MMGRELNEAFNDFFYGSFSSSDVFATKSDKGITIYFLIPGRDTSDIDISVVGGRLVVEAKPMKIEGDSIFGSKPSSYKRTVGVEIPYTEQDIVATYTQGVLKIVVNENKERKIKIN